MNVDRSSVVRVTSNKVFISAFTAGVPIYGVLVATGKLIRFFHNISKFAKSLVPLQYRRSSHGQVRNCPYIKIC